jgi:hypothetical protein
MESNSVSRLSARRGKFLLNRLAAKADQLWVSILMPINPGFVKMTDIAFRKARQKAASGHGGLFDV